MKCARCKYCGRTMSIQAYLDGRRALCDGRPEPLSSLKCVPDRLIIYKCKRKEE